METIYIRNCIGAYLLLLPSKLLFCLSNMFVYVPSYILLEAGKKSVATSREEVRETLFYPLFALTWTIGLMTSRCIAKVITPRWTIALGLSIASLTFFVSGCTVQVSVPVFFSILCLGMGLGTGVYEGLLLKHYVVDESKACNNTVTAVVISAGSLGGATINLFITLYINPDNLSPDGLVGDYKVFTQKEILERIPSIFPVIGGGILLLGLPGFLMLTERESLEKVDESITLPSEIQTNTLESKSQKNEAKDSGQVRMSGANSSILKEGEGSGVKRYGGGIGSRAVSVSSPPAACTDDARVFTSDQKVNSYSPCQLLRTNLFYKVSVAYSLSTSARLLLGVHYKLYGELWIEDDHFLTNLGIAISFVASFSSVVIGLFIAKAGIKWCFIGIYSGLAIGFLTMFILIHLDKWAYFTATLVTASCSYGLFTIYTVALYNWFGKEYYESNIGLLEVPSTLGFFVTSFVIEQLLSHFGYFSAFALTASCQIVALVLICLFFPDI